MNLTVDLRVVHDLVGMVIDRRLSPIGTDFKINPNGLRRGALFRTESDLNLISKPMTTDPICHFTPPS
jgi:hypothetical protein